MTPPLICTTPFNSHNRKLATCYRYECIHSFPVCYITLITYSHYQAKKRNFFSQAYSCLSDTVKRSAFNSERRKYFCIKCNRIPYTTRSRSTRIKQSVKYIKERFKEEARVMESCLRANDTLRGQTPLFSPSENLYKTGHFRCGGRRESPIFNPSDYLFEGYPHIRNRIYMKPEEVWYSKRQNSSNYAQRNSRYDSPVFENRSVRSFETGSAFVSS